MTDQLPVQDRAAARAMELGFTRFQINVVPPGKGSGLLPEPRFCWTMWYGVDSLGVEYGEMFRGVDTAKAAESALTCFEAYPNDIKGG